MYSLRLQNSITVIKLQDRIDANRCSLAFGISITLLDSGKGATRPSSCNFRIRIRSNISFNNKLDANGLHRFGMG